MSLDKLNEAISLAKAGDKAGAGKLIKEYVREDPSSEAAWLWLSICVDAIEQKRYCLNKAIAINPGNENSRKALEQLDAPAPPAPTFSELTSQQPVAIPQPVIVPRAPVVSRSQYPPSRAQTPVPIRTTPNQPYPVQKRKTWWPWAVGGIGLMMIIACITIGLIFRDKLTTIIQVPITAPKLQEKLAGVWVITSPTDSPLINTGNGTPPFNFVFSRNGYASFDPDTIADMVTIGAPGVIPFTVISEDTISLAPIKDDSGRTFSFKMEFSFSSDDEAMVTVIENMDGEESGNSAQIKRILPDSSTGNLSKDISGSFFYWGSFLQSGNIRFVPDGSLVLEEIVNNQVQSSIPAGTYQIKGDTLTINYADPASGSSATFVLTNIIDLGNFFIMSATDVYQDQRTSIVPFLLLFGQGVDYWK